MATTTDAQHCDEHGWRHKGDSNFPDRSHCSQLPGLSNGWIRHQGLEQLFD